jgi:hypothetical protein
VNRKGLQRYRALFSDSVSLFVIFVFGKGGGERFESERAGRDD